MEEIVLSGTLAKCGWRPFYRKAEKKLAEEKMKRMESVGVSESPVIENLSGGAAAADASCESIVRSE